MAVDMNQILVTTGGRSTMVHVGMTEPYIRKGDVVGCALDLSVPVMTFYLNGVKVKGNFRNFNLDGMFFPVVSCSARVRYLERRSVLISFHVIDMFL